MVVRKKWLVTGSLAVKLAFAAVLIGHTGAQAAPGGSYTAALTTPLAAPRQDVLSGLLWKCAGAQCAAPADGSRPVLVCQRVARTFGPVSRFTAPAGELSSDELIRCNAST
jgi:hypothetical protein